MHTHGGINAAGKLRIGIGLTVLILVVELAGGFISNSLALLSDAGHVFVDVIALSLSWYGLRQAERPSSARMTFGYHRVGVLVAIVNATSIFAIAAVILYEAYRRLVSPPEVNSVLMMSLALVGLAVNVFVVYWLRKEQQTNLNIRSAFFHASGDALASIGVIIGGAVIFLTGALVADPIISILIGIIISYAAWTIFREGVRVILEAPPRHVDVDQMVGAIRAVPGVRDVHDVHVWSISPELHAMSSHVLIDDLHVSESAKIREKIQDILLDRFGVGHATVQMECQQCEANDIYCSLTYKNNSHRHAEGSG